MTDKVKKNWTIPQIKKEINSLVKFGTSEHSIQTIVRSKVPESFMDSGMLSTLVIDTLDEHPNFNLIQKIYNSKLSINKQSDDNKIFYFDPDTMKEDSVSKSHINTLFSKFDFSSKVSFCDFEYNPEVFKKHFTVDGVKKYNLFNPPFWLAKYFYYGIEVENSSMPELFDRYLKHFTNDHDESYEYVLDWLAYSLRHRNNCILTAIGNQGTGKGVLGEIIRRLWCSDDKFDSKYMNNNFDSIMGSAFKKEFNGFLENKRVFYIDEIMINSVDQEDRVKVLVNDFISVEKKGEDAKTIKNFASIYVSSNNLDSIRLRADDRRFSILEMSSDNLLTKFTKREIEDQMMCVDNIRKFGQYLWSREVDPKKMQKVFVTERTKSVREASLREWEEYFIETICEDNKGKRLLITEVSDLIENNFGSKFRPSRAALGKLNQLYPNEFKIHRPAINGKRRYCVDFKNFEEE